jgi:hypothetical protein
MYSQYEFSAEGFGSHLDEHGSTRILDQLTGARLAVRTAEREEQGRYIEEDSIADSQLTKKIMRKTTIPRPKR